MRIKRMKIGIKSADAFLAEAEATMTRVAKGEHTRKERGVYFENLATVRRVLTDRRLAILHAIKESHPVSVYALARLLSRDIRNVVEDLEYLRDLGLVDLKKTQAGRARTVPSVDYEMIRLDIAV